ncbi:hypothetical protein NDU88_005424 [Pleurodeles waltl]|uniref:Uncharacterized protein n=1 Tax=Pleurodeles waltl TaxID=8319 RepID=A0AAV7L0R4_PLEWA|nr:hypothetical protein NDU88_005424 [Pleurodeles waltl]
MELQALSCPQDAVAMVTALMPPVPRVRRAVPKKMPSLDADTEVIPGVSVEPTLGGSEDLAQSSDARLISEYSSNPRGNTLELADGGGATGPGLALGSQ